MTIIERHIMQTTKHFAVIGNPIAHSRSPELHQVFAQKTGITLVYNKRLAQIGQFESSIDEFFKNHGTGLNVTVPFKEDAFKACDVLTERAKIAKAVNTLWQKEGKLYGDNTDGQGLVNAINALEWPLSQSRILILGAGGATRGVIFPLAEAGAHEIVIANRTLSRATQLIQDLSPHIQNTSLNAVGLDQLTGHFDIVINATSASLSGDALLLPESLTFNYAYEMAYGKPSHFLDEAKKRNIPYADGFGMLVGQAIESFYIWNGIRPNLKEFL